MLDGMLAALLAHPRSFLLLHIGPILNQYPELGGAIVGEIRHYLTNWCQSYTLFASHGVKLRPG
ncbi:hypothetical protein ACWCOV_10025 [Kribbella sp. NPDC002412]